MRRTKIVCTLGPASSDRETLSRMILSGMDVARLNFSHGSHESQHQAFALIRNLSRELNKPVAILQDLCGPKIRTGGTGTSDGIRLQRQQIFTLTTDAVQGDEKGISVTYPHLPREVSVGQRVFLDDGAIEMVVQKTTDREVVCEVLNSGLLKSHKGVNIPGAFLSVSSLTDKDRKDALAGISWGVDFIALSFVRRPSDVMELRKFLQGQGSSIPIIAKIEKSEAVRNLDEILSLVDGVMVARGDLGVEIPLEEVPLVQKSLIRKANVLAKPVITATQMLNSMIESPLPTRAEVTDVANAVLDGTDAVMLSGETAVGLYPVEAVSTMARISEKAEEALHYDEITLRKSGSDVAEAVSLAACELAQELEARAILVSTRSGRTARLISKYRPQAPILAASPEEETLRRLVLSWNTFPLSRIERLGTDELMEEAEKAALDAGVIEQGDLVIAVLGLPGGPGGGTNTVKVHTTGMACKT